MKINRQNYETFFLLYVDRELSAAENQEVAAFLIANPDLAAEMDAFMQTRLKPDNTPGFPDKNSLLKSGSTAVTLLNYEEFFLRHVDRELSENETSEVAAFLEKHPEKLREMRLLEQTILPPETLEFTHKELLLRETKNPRRIVPIYWRRIALAAAVAGFGFLCWWLVSGGKSVRMLPAPGAISSGMARNHPFMPDSMGSPGLPGTAHKTAGTTVLNLAVKRTAIQESSVGGANNDPDRRVISFGETPANKTRKQVQTSVSDGREISAKTDLPLVLQPAGTSRNELLKKIQPATPPLLNEEDSANQQSSSSEPVYAALDDNGLAKPVTYKELNTSEDNQSTLYLGSIKLNKNKVRGFLKMASHLFGGRTKQQTDGSIEVANLQIDTKKL